jgi:hypothetical protein
MNTIFLQHESTISFSAGEAVTQTARRSVRRCSDLAVWLTVTESSDLDPGTLWHDTLEISLKLCADFKGCAAACSESQQCCRRRYFFCCLKTLQFFATAGPGTCLARAGEITFANSFRESLEICTNRVGLFS